MKLNLKCLEHVAYKLRVDSLKSTTAAGSGHPTTALSAVDMVTALFFNVMNYDILNPDDPNNDRFILSKGHGVPVLYSAWKEMGALTEEELLKLRDFDSVLEGHPTPRFRYSEAATGSLGMGLSIGLGMVLAGRMSNSDYYTYVMLGDSEMTEGSVWEAIYLSSYYKAHKLIALLDVNKFGQSTETIEKHDLESFQVKFKAFGWNTILIDGHNIQEILDALGSAKKSEDKPTVIIACTEKGYGLPDDIEGELKYHGKAFSKEKLPELLQHLKKQFSKAAMYECDHVLSKDSFAPIVRENISKMFKPEKAIELSDPEYKQGDELATRKAFGQALKALGDQSDLIVSLDAEVKNSTYAETFEKAHPDRFLQSFIAEQNMIGMAEGFALRGFIPFASTFASFLSRAHDQIRMSAIGRVPLRIVGSHAGVSIGEDGPSQMGLEDIAIMRALPDSIVLYPCDAVSTYNLVNIAANYKEGISYIRTTRKDTPIIYDNNDKFKIGGCRVLEQDHSQDQKDDLCIMVAGITVFEALKAYDMLKKLGIKASVIDVYSVKPLDHDTLERMVFKSSKRVLTVEDHYLAGGLGEAICYQLRNHDFEFQSLAIKKVSRSGKPEELLSYHEIDADAIVKKAIAMVKD